MTSAHLQAQAQLWPSIDADSSAEGDWRKGPLLLTDNGSGDREGRTCIRVLRCQP